MQSEEARWSQKHTQHGGDADARRYGAAGGMARAYCSPENSKLNLPGSGSLCHPVVLVVSTLVFAELILPTRRTLV